MAPHRSKATLLPGFALVFALALWTRSAVDSFVAGYGRAPTRSALATTPRSQALHDDGVRELLLGIDSSTTLSKVVNQAVKQETVVKPKARTQLKQKPKGFAPAPTLELKTMLEPEPVAHVKGVVPAPTPELVTMLEPEPVAHVKAPEPIVEETLEPIVEKAHEPIAEESQPIVEEPEPAIEEMVPVAEESEEVIAMVSDSLEVEEDCEKAEECLMVQQCSDEHMQTLDSKLATDEVEVEAMLKKTSSSWLQALSQRIKSLRARLMGSSEARKEPLNA